MGCDSRNDTKAVELFSTVFNGKKFPGKGYTKQQRFEKNWKVKLKIIVIIKGCKNSYNDY